MPAATRWPARGGRDSGVLLQVRRDRRDHRLHELRATGAAVREGGVALAAVRARASRAVPLGPRVPRGGPDARRRAGDAGADPQLPEQPVREGRAPQHRQGVGDGRRAGEGRRRVRPVRRPLSRGRERRRRVAQGRRSLRRRRTRPARGPAQARVHHRVPERRRDGDGDPRGASAPRPGDGHAPASDLDAAAAADPRRPNPRRRRARPRRRGRCDEGRAGSVTDVVPGRVPEARGREPEARLA